MRTALLASALSVTAGFAISSGALAQSADIFDPAAPVVSQLQPRNASGGLIPQGAPCGATVYDNGPLINNAGGGTGGADLSVLQGSLGLNTLGAGHQVLNNNRVADQFTVPAGGWQLGCAVFYAYQTGSTTTSTITAVNVRIWDGTPGAMGSNIVFGDTTTNRMISTSWSNIYRATETTLTATDRPIMAQVVDLGSLNLAAGTYWIDWQTDGTLGSGPWAPPITINGQAATGDALQSLAGAAYGPLLDTGTNTPPQGLPFVLLAPPGAPTLSLGAVSVDFGNVVNGQSGSASMTLSNTGTAALSVTAHTAPALPFAAAGGTCAGVPFSLAPGASCSLNYSFSPTAVASSSQVITVSSNGGNLTFTLQGAGVTGQPPALARPAVIPSNDVYGLGLLALLTLGFAGWSLQRRR
jgi:hypothetical protein